MVSNVNVMFLVNTKLCWQCVVISKAFALIIVLILSKICCVSWIKRYQPRYLLSALIMLHTNSNYRYSSHSRSLVRIFCAETLRLDALEWRVAADDELSLLDKGFFVKSLQIFSRLPSRINVQRYRDRDERSSCKFQCWNEMLWFPENVPLRVLMERACRCLLAVTIYL